MALTKNMTPNQMIDFIDNELLPQVKQEIGNWIYPKKKQGGYFVVTRQIFCMIDFLGAVYSGYPLSERKHDPDGRKIAISPKAIRFMRAFFEPKKSYKRATIIKMYDMCRNGLVHLYQPKILKLNNNKVLFWFIYRGSRYIPMMSADSNLGKVHFKNVNHLKIMSIDPKHKIYYLPTSIDCLYEDFVDAVERYKKKLQSNNRLQTHWRTTANAILEPR